VQKKEELKRLKNLMQEKLKEKLKKVQEISGLDGTYSLFFILYYAKNIYLFLIFSCKNNRYPSW